MNDCLCLPHAVIVSLVFSLCRDKTVFCKNSGHRVSVFDVRGQRVQTFGSQDDRPEQMIYPAGIAVDDVDNIYVSSKHKLQKFTSSGELIKCVGQRGRKEGEFYFPVESPCTAIKCMYVTQITTMFKCLAWT